MRTILLPVPKGGMNGINHLIDILCIKALSGTQYRLRSGEQLKTQEKGGQ